MAITIDDFSKIWASTSPLTPYEFSEDNYKQGWNFVGGAPPSRQMWDFLQKNNDEKMQYLANNYLPLSGGTMTGAIMREGTIAIGSADTSYVQMYGGTGFDHGAWIQLCGKDHTGLGRWLLQANNGTDKKALVGNADGTLTWDNNNVLTDAAVGTIVSNSPSADVSVPQSTATTITSVSLSAGTWVVTSHLYIQSSNITVNKVYIVGIDTSANTLGQSTEGSMITIPPVSANISVQTMRILKLSATTTVYMNVLATSPTVVNNNSSIRAVRIV